MTEKEKIVVDYQYKEFCAQLFPSIQPRERALINKAFCFAYNAHKGVSRLSDAPHITHSINVAYIVALEMKKMNLGPVCVAGALLHDVLNRTDAKFEELEQNFDKEVVMIVDGLTKTNSHHVAHYPTNPESLKTILEATIKDIRVILIKIANRLDNMRSIRFLPQAKRFHIASETKEIYVKVASLLELEKIKRELDDLCLKTMYPQKYYKLSTLVEAYSNQRVCEVNELRETITKTLKAHDIPFSSKIRSKSISSIHHKMSRKRISFRQIYDLIGIRIIIPNKNGKLNCWRIYGIITSLYCTDRKRIKDWITKPKGEQGYESLHLTILGNRGSSIEVQIRTRRMHEIATRGSAAHWKYKEKDLAAILSDFDDSSRNALNTVLYNKKALKRQDPPVEMVSK